MKFEEPDCENVPVGCALTMVGTGSEMNAGAVIESTLILDGGYKVSECDDIVTILETVCKG